MRNTPKVLGIETSCDDTAVAVVSGGSVVLSNVVASQSDMHFQYGGIVPEIASREHFQAIVTVVDRALHDAEIKSGDIDAIAVTNGPGLAGALLVGVNAAKGFALAWDKPVIGINHLEGHIYSSWLEGMNPEDQAGFPLVCLIASGGHTDLYLMKDHGVYCTIGRTRDDAAGEAFDKAARVLGLGFPGGPEIEDQAQHVSESRISLPRPSIKGSLDFSFSGLKSAFVRAAEEAEFFPEKRIGRPTKQEIYEFAHEFQEAVVDCLVRSSIAAVNSYGAKGIILGGGVAANSRLRAKIAEICPVPMFVPRPGLCTDNGAMIGSAGYFHTIRGITTEWDMDVVPNLKLAANISIEV